MRPVTEADNQSDATRAVTPAGLASRAKLASPTFTGSPKAPTPGANDNSTRIPTTAWVKARIAGLVSNATTTARGIVELATITEAKNGTDTERAVTPAGLKASTGNVRQVWLFWDSDPSNLTGKQVVTLSESMSNFRVLTFHVSGIGLTVGRASGSQEVLPALLQTSEPPKIAGVNWKIWGSGTTLNIKFNGSSAIRVYGIRGIG